MSEGHDWFWSVQYASRPQAPTNRYECRKCGVGFRALEKPEPEKSVGGWTCEERLMDQALQEVHLT